MADSTNNQSSESPWQTLARTNNLSFFQNTGQVTGGYRGHCLTLSHSVGGSTHITLFVNDSPRNYRLLKSKVAAVGAITVVDVFASLTPTSVLDTLKGHISASASGLNVSYKQRGFEKDVAYLQFVFDLLCDLATIYPQLVAKGGEVVPPLQVIAKNTNHKLHRFVITLLQDIAQRTRMQLFDLPSRPLLCLNCLVYCGVNKVWLPQFDPITYYGCRACGQSQDFLQWEGRIIAVLDSEMTVEQIQQNCVLKSNWLIRREIFDFDEVQVVQATDEDVERFAVQVGNDTDEVRKPRYKKMRCTVSTGCQLSANTMRILQRMFGKVERVSTHY